MNSDDRRREHTRGETDASREYRHVPAYSKRQVAKMREKPRRGGTL